MQIKRRTRKKQIAELVGPLQSPEFFKIRIEKLKTLLINVKDNNLNYRKVDLIEDLIVLNEICLEESEKCEYFTTIGKLQ